MIDCKLAFLHSTTQITNICNNYSGFFEENHEICRGKWYPAKNNNVGHSEFKAQILGKQSSVIFVEYRLEQRFPNF